MRPPSGKVVAAAPMPRRLCCIATTVKKDGLGVLAQLHFFLDDLFPHTLGKPLF
jgi:hypothetical protein